MTYSVAATAKSLGNFILEWADPPPPELLPLLPAHASELEERIAAAKKYQDQLREEYRQTGKPPSDDPFAFYEPTEKRPAQLDAMIARRGSLDKRNRKPKADLQEETSPSPPDPT